MTVSKSSSSQQTSLQCVNSQCGIQWRGQYFVTKKFTSIYYGKRLATLNNNKNFIICIWIAKLEVIKRQFFCISAIVAEYMLKIWFIKFQKYCTNMPKVRWVCLYLFCSKFARFAAMQKLSKSVNIWQSHTYFKGGKFLDTQWLVVE